MQTSDLLLYDHSRLAGESAPWTQKSTTATDCTFQQLAPYIGRVKTTIAAHLIEEYSSRGELIVDPFCGSGVIPLEASMRARRVFASDINPYGVLLTKAKLTAPRTEVEALARFSTRWERAQTRLCNQDLRRIPKWVRGFFHPETLRNVLALRDELVADNDDFLLACLLGILHHQRPGFLSYPSSHLVPYLRSKLFPRNQFPQLYEERDVYSRMVAKIRRTYRRPPLARANAHVALCDSRYVRRLSDVSAVITSPPYMNELDYVRDNRLRLWFIGRALPITGDIPRRDRENSFKQLMRATLMRLSTAVVPSGRIILIVGDASRGGRSMESTGVITQLFSEETKLSKYRLTRVICDDIPDVRRSRRDLQGTKRETILVYQKQI